MSSAGQEEELIRQAVGGDRGALLKLLGRSRQPLCAYIAHKIPITLRGALDAEDVVQDAHVEVFRAIATFEPRGADSFDGWVRTIAARKLRDAVRRHRTAKRGGGRAGAGAISPAMEKSMIALLDLVAAPARTPSSVAAHAEGVEVLQAAMRQLPEDYRRALWMMHIQERSAADVAAELGRTEGAIRVLCHKARKRLGEILGNRSRFLSSSG